MTVAEHCQVVLPPRLLAALAPLAPSTPRTLSPLVAADSDGASANGDGEALRALGVVDDAGAVAPRFRRAVSVLAAARSAVRVELGGGSGGIEYDQWFDVGGGPPVSLMPTAAGMRLDDPAAAPDLLELVSQAFGESVLQGADVDVELDAEHAFVLAAVIDAHRRQILRAIADRVVPTPARFDLKAMTAAVTDAGAGPQWVTGALADFFDVAPPDADVIPGALHALVERGHLVADGSAFALAEPVAELGRRLLVVQTVLHLAAGRERDDGEVARAGFACLQAGGRDVLLIERVGDRIRLETSSAATVLSYARWFLTDADALAEHPDPAPSHEPSIASGGWAPTHAAPDAGLPTWAAPDPAADPTAPLGPGLPVKVDDRRGDWVHVVCSNGWGAWADGRSLVALTR